MEEKEISAASEAVKKKDTLPRIITGAGIFAVLVLLFWTRLSVSGLFFDGAIFLLIFVGGAELVLAAKKHTTPTQRWIVLVYCATLALPYYLSGRSVEAVFFYLIAFFLILAAASLFCKSVTFEGLAATFMMLVYPAISLFCMVILNNLNEGFALLLLLFASVCFCDIFAYVTGVTLGKGTRKLCPDISPNKTYIGAFGGLAGGLIGSLLVWLLIDVLNLFAIEYILFEGSLKILHYILTGILLSLFTMTGDLLASLIKRKVGIKDYGKIFPGHGGVMDRFDGNMMAAMFLVLYVTLLT